MRSDQQLNRKREQLLNKLYSLLDENKQFSDPIVVAVSQELDKIIVKLQKRVHSLTRISVTHPISLLASNGGGFFCFFSGAGSKSCVDTEVGDGYN